MPGRWLLGGLPHAAAVEPGAGSPAGHVSWPVVVLGQRQAAMLFDRRSRPLHCTAQAHWGRGIGSSAFGCSFLTSSQPCAGAAEAAAEARCSPQQLWQRIEEVYESAQQVGVAHATCVYRAEHPNAAAVQRCTPAWVFIAAAAWVSPIFKLRTHGRDRCRAAPHSRRTRAQRCSATRRWRPPLILCCASRRR